MRLRKIIALFLFVAVLTSAGRAQQKTTVVVRARARNAKFIGDETGGAMITILNASTGDTLASGLTKGGTGDIRRLIKEPVKRYEKLSTPGAAKFTAHLSLQKPTLVTIRATANVNNEGTNITSSTQKWIIPGRDITGDGVILEMPGFILINRRPGPDKTYQTGTRVPIRAKITMMCGCPSKPGGLWDSNAYEIKAIISKDGQAVKSMPLSFAGETSFYNGSFKPTQSGRYQITVYAFNAKTGNSGVAKTRIEVQK